MAKKSNNNALADLLTAKSPEALRKPIKPVAILDAAAGVENPNASEPVQHATDHHIGEGDTKNTSLQEVAQSDEQKRTDQHIRESVEDLRTESTAEKTDMLEVSDNQQKETDEQIDDIVPKNKGVVKNRSVNRSEKPGKKSASKSTARKPHVYSEQTVHAVLALDKRATKRYSFEIYVDQDDDIKKVCELYEKQTEGVTLSASRLIREVLDTFLPDALKALREREV